jgi:hypothetical protein
MKSLGDTSGDVTGISVAYWNNNDELILIAFSEM